MKVVFVCLGNICRSPMAEAVFRKMVHEEGLEDKITIDSAATSTWEHGNPVHHGTRKKLEEHGMMPSLPPKLRETAQLRQDNPEATLSELAQMQQPPVSKSAINHRMRKLIELSKQL